MPCTSSTSAPDAASPRSPPLARGVDVTAETCPHYLVFDEDDLERLGAVAKCAPPLRPRCEVDSLWQALVRGEIQIVASDHSRPHRT